MSQEIFFDLQTLYFQSHLYVINEVYRENQFQKIISFSFRQNLLQILIINFYSNHILESIQRLFHLLIIIFEIIYIFKWLFTNQEFNFTLIYHQLVLGAHHLYHFVIFIIQTIFLFKYQQQKLMLLFRKFLVILIIFIKMIHYFLN